MILVKDFYNFGPFEIKTYKGYYYKSKAAQKANNKTWFRYIDRIQILDHDGILIKGEKGTLRFIGYTIQQAIKKYNQYKREA